MGATVPIFPFSEWGKGTDVVADLPQNKEPVAGHLGRLVEAGLLPTLQFILGGLPLVPSGDGAGGGGSFLKVSVGGVERPIPGASG